jgi:hypothetical protein
MASRILAMAMAMTATVANGAEKEHRLVDTPEFTVQLPAGAVRNEFRSGTALVPVKNVNWAAERGNVTIGLVYSEPVMAPDAERGLDGGRDGALGAIGAKLDREERISITDANGNTWPGRLIFAHLTSSPVTLEVRMYLVNTRIYELALFQAKGAPRPTDFDRMVKSFRVKKD